MNRRRFWRLIITLLVIGIPILGLWQREYIFDQVRLHGYVPSSTVVKLADDTAMQPSMRKLFYVYHPSVEEKTAFNSSCRRDELTIVLGCYVEGQGIYLLSVTDSRLSGVEQVTAAHETLHAAYARLSSKERKRVDAMTSAYFATTTNQRLKDTIELYKKQDASVVPNELHSILGTEIRQLPGDLENYYKQYFSDRLKVVGFSEQYEQAFTARKNQIASYDTQLNSLKDQINNLQASLEAQSLALANERAGLNQLKASGQFEAYNAAIPGFNKRVSTYNQGVDTITSLIDQYNGIAAARNALASEELELVQAIDSRSTVPARQ
jgi:uncharacterized protein YdaU (DUF1376 family)